MSFDYLLNDPSTPNLRITIDTVPLSAHPPLTVNGYNGLVNVPDTIEQHAAQVSTSIAYVFDFVQKSYRGTLSRWAATNNLVAFPHAGIALNAYYDRSSLRFFAGFNKFLNKTSYSCMSADVVAHELGHAILDCIRPDMWSVPALEIMSFHESFGDMISILKALHHEEVISYMLNETAGDLTHPSIVANVAEEFGAALFPQHPTYLRNANNLFMYVEPEKLPVSGPDEQLTAEPHSFSRVFTGAFWDILVGIYERYKSQSWNIAIHTARDIMTRLLLNAMPLAPLNPRFYKGMVTAMLVVDKNLHNSEVSDIIRFVFARRGIARDITFLLPHPLHNQLIIVPLGHELSIGRDKVVRAGKVSTFKLRGRDELAYKIDNPLYDVQVDVPNEMLIHLDEHSRQLARFDVDLKSAVRCVQSGLDYLHLRNDTNFGIIDGKLTRLRSC